MTFVPPNGEHLTIGEAANDTAKVDAILALIERAPKVDVGTSDQMKAAGNETQHNLDRIAAEHAGEAVSMTYENVQGQLAYATMTRVILAGCEQRGLRTTCEHITRDQMFTSPRPLHLVLTAHALTCSDCLHTLRLAIETGLVSAADGCDFCQREVPLYRTAVFTHGPLTVAGEYCDECIDGLQATLQRLAPSDQ